MIVYFRLATDSFLVLGKTDGVIYDLGRNRLLLLDPGAAALVKRCESNQPTDDLEPGSAEMALLDKLVQRGVGNFLPSPHFVEKLQFQSPVRFQGIAADPPRFDRLTLQITDRCGLACKTCRLEGHQATWQPCTACLMRALPGERAHPSGDDFDALFDDLRRLEFKNLHLRGGDPLAEPDLLADLLRRAAARYPELIIFVTTPGEGRLPNLATVPSQVRFNVVLLGTSAKDYEEAAGCGAAWDRVVSNVDSLRAADSQGAGRLLVTILLTETTRARKDELLAFAKDRWGLTPGLAETYPYPLTGWDGPPRFSHVGPRAKPVAPFRDTWEFFFRAYNNTCLFGGVDLGLDGGFRPCAWVDEVFGHWPAESLHTAMSRPQPYHYWELTKEGIEGCRECALRYACADCTVAELDGQLLPGVRDMYCPLNLSEDLASGRVRPVLGPAEFIEEIVLAEGSGHRG